MVLTEKVKKEIRETTKIIIKDIRNIVKDYPKDELSVFAFKQPILKHGEYWNLSITNRLITLIDKDQKSFSPIVKGGRRKLMLDDADYLAQYYLIKNYDDIRKRIENEVISEMLEVNKKIEVIENIKHKYKEKKKPKKATIEIELPPVTNQYELEVTEEDGKTIGKLNFNGLTLTLLAQEGIKIVNKTEIKQRKK